MFKLLKERMGHDDSYSNSYQDYFMEREQIIFVQSCWERLDKDKEAILARGI